MNYWIWMKSLSQIGIKKGGCGLPAYIVKLYHVTFNVRKRHRFQYVTLWEAHTFAGAAHAACAPLSIDFVCKNLANGRRGNVGVEMSMRGRGKWKFRVAALLLHATWIQLMQRWLYCSYYYVLWFCQIWVLKSKIQLHKYYSCVQIISCSLLNQWKHIISWEPEGHYHYSTMLHVCC